MVHNFENVDLGNLAILAMYLESLPEDYDEFRMGDYMYHNQETTFEKGIDSKEADLGYMKKNGGICGTAACAVGHGPCAGIKVDMRTKRAKQLFSKDSICWGVWEAYTEYAFGINWNDEDLLLNDFLFGGSWENHDNSVYGAAARIWYILDGNWPFGEEEEADFDLQDFSELIDLYEPYLKGNRNDT